MRIYLAARYTRREELCGRADDLRAIGHEVTSRWLLGAHQALDVDLMTTTDADVVAKRERFALDDLEDLFDAHWLISFTEPPRSGHSRGGRHVEFGVGAALGKRLVVVGHRENVFHCLPNVEFFDAWPAALTAIRERPYCNACGCTEMSACLSPEGVPCSWAEPGLCSSCVAPDALTTIAGLVLP